MKIFQPVQSSTAFVTSFLLKLCVCVFFLLFSFYFRSWAQFPSKWNSNQTKQEKNKKKMNIKSAVFVIHSSSRNIRITKYKFKMKRETMALSLQTFVSAFWNVNRQNGITKSENLCNRKVVLAHDDFLGSEQFSFWIKSVRQFISCIAKLQSLGTYLFVCNKYRRCTIMYTMYECVAHFSFIHYVVAVFFYSLISYYIIEMHIEIHLFLLSTVFWVIMQFSPFSEIFAISPVKLNRTIHTPVCPICPVCNERTTNTLWRWWHLWRNPIFL